MTISTLSRCHFPQAVKKFNMRQPYKHVYVVDAAVALCDTILVQPDHKGLYKQVGSLIASHRRMRKYTQAALAVTLGLSRASIANIERGEQTVQLHSLFQIADLLDVPPTSLLPENTDMMATLGTLRDSETLRRIQTKGFLLKGQR
jgi:DNA-binding XRE family transcriptional regulator